MWYNLSCRDEQNTGAFCFSAAANPHDSNNRGQSALHVSRTCVLAVRLDNGGSHGGRFAVKTQKRCPKCNEYKDRSEFGNNKTTYDGLSWYCKKCNRQYKIDNPEKRREERRLYMRKRRKRETEERRKTAPERAAARLIICEQKRIEREIKIQEEKERKFQEREYKRKLAKERARELRALRWHQTGKAKRENNIEEYRYYNRNRMKVRRIIQRTNGGSITKEQWKIICDHFGNVCLCCGNPETAYKELSIDHIIPVTKGGTSDWDNLQPLCFSCNSRKHTDIVDYRPSHLMAELEVKIKRAEVKNACEPHS